MRNQAKWIWVVAAALGPWGMAAAPGAAGDWMLAAKHAEAGVQELAEGREVVLENGLVRRTFWTGPNFATVALDNLMTGASVLRGVKPEGAIELDGKRYEIGGLKGQPEYAYLDPGWLADMKASPEAFRYVRHEAGATEARYAWKPKRWAGDAPWPPKGRSLTVLFAPPEGERERYAGLAVRIHYEMYDGLPCIVKWVTVENGGELEVEIGALDCEILAVNEGEKPRLGVESSYAFAGMQTTLWGPDAEYLSQIDWERQMPLLLTSRYPLGPGMKLRKGERLESFRTVEVVYDSDDRERRGLVRRRMYRMLSPQGMENPIFMHVRSADPAAVRLAVDQCAGVGFEMVIMTFGSGFNIESEDPRYRATMKELVDYAHGRGIELGGYTLMCASRDAGAALNCIDPRTGRPGSKFGQSACMASEYADGYFRRVLGFLDATGLDMIETDGPYHGDVCASTRHKHHRGLADSQVRQFEAMKWFYGECRRRGIYTNVPDNYFFVGTNKTAMGYREENFSLPRERQIVISRQNIFDGTWEKPPSMGWMFVPLVQYHGGGAAATFEPLREHLADYERHLAQNFGSGVQACYRGPRLFDAPETRDVVKKWVDFYKRHRAILNSDIVHVRRPDGRGLDCILHVNPGLKERGLAMVYNPTDAAIEGEVMLPLYYAGLSERAMIRVGEGAMKEYPLDRECRADVKVRVEAKSAMWLVVE